MLTLEYAQKNVGTKKSPKIATLIVSAVKVVSDVERAGEERRILALPLGERAKALAALDKALKPKTIKGRGVYDAAFGLSKVALTKGERRYLLEQIQRLARLSGLRPEEVFVLREDEEAVAELVAEIAEVAEAA